MFEVANTSVPGQVLGKSAAARRRFDQLLGFNFSAPSESRQGQSEDAEP
jgi:hypothetical protein